MGSGRTKPDAVKLASENWVESSSLGKVSFQRGGDVFTQVAVNVSVERRQKALRHGVNLMAPNIGSVIQTICFVRMDGDRIRGVASLRFDGDYRGVRTSCEMRVWRHHHIESPGTVIFWDWLAWVGCDARCALIKKPNIPLLHLRSSCSPSANLSTPSAFPCSSVTSSMAAW